MWTPGPSLPENIVDGDLWLYHNSAIPRANVPNYEWSPGNDKVDGAFNDLRKWAIQEQIDRLKRRNPWLDPSNRKPPRRSLPKKTEPEAPVTPPKGGWFGG